MDKKIVFFDLDGTLVMHTQNGSFIPNSAIKALTKAKENGHLLFISTGRSLAMIDDELLNNPLFDGVIAASGACILYKGEIIFHRPYDKDDLNSLRNLLESNNIFHWLESNEGIFFNVDMFKEQYLERKKRSLPRFFEKLKPIDEECLNKINKVSYVDTFNPFSFEEKLLANKYILVPMSYDGQGENRGEISPLNISKGTAIKYVLNKLNIEKKWAYCFGDSNNDLSMFPYVGVSICMGNGKEEVKKKATYATKNIDDGGIEHGLRYFGLI